MTHTGGAPSATALDVERTIGPDASRTHIRFPFVLDRDAEGLEILFSYDPKVLTDDVRERALIEAGLRAYAGSLETGRPRERLNNLLTLSLDGPTGFRGCAHRHSPAQSITLGRAAATPGFIPGAVEAGAWTATISVHAVVTEQCSFRLRMRVLS